MSPVWTAVIAFAGGSLSAALISAFARHCIWHPVISVRLDGERGSDIETTAVPIDKDGQPAGEPFQAKCLRLQVENTGLSSIKDCSGYITKITKRVGGRQSDSRQEVVELSWAHKKDGDPRDIPRNAFFHMDVVALHLRPDERVLHLRHYPNSLRDFLTDRGTYEFEVLVAADNARPRRRIPVSFDYDPDSDQLPFIPVKRVRFPWWAWWRWPRFWWRGN